VRPTSAGPPG